MAAPVTNHAGGLTGAQIRGGINSGLAEDGKSAVAIRSTDVGELHTSDENAHELFQGQCLEMLRSILTELRLTRRAFCNCTGHHYEAERQEI